MPPGPPIYAAILLCSLGVLMQEVLLTRIFSFTIWYHLAYLTISTALLGFGAAGSLLAAFPRLYEQRPERTAAAASAGAAVALLAGAFILADRPISPDAILTDPAGFFLALLGYYIAVTLPFLLAGVAVATPLSAWARHASPLYAADLLGAGLGCVAAVVALSFLDGEAAVAACAAILLAAAALYTAPGRTSAALAVLALVLGAASPYATTAFRFMPTETKILGHALRQPGTEMLFTRWSPVNRVDVYRQQEAGFWSWIGVSRSFRGLVPRTLSLQYDAHNGTDVFEVRGSDSLRFLDQHVLRSPYVVRERPRVLVIGVGGGIDVLNALRRGAPHVTGVDLQGITLELHRGPLAEWTHGALLRPEVELVVAEGRHFVRSRPDVYDVIQITAVDTFSAQTTGAYVLAESYLYTVEAFADYLARLDDDGLVSLVIGDLLYDDPRVATPYSTRLALVAREALARRGAPDPAAHLLAVTQRSGSTGSNPIGTGNASQVTTLLVKKSPFRPDELERLRAFTLANGFELLLDPAAESDGSAFSRLARADDGERAALLGQQPFVLDPVTDDSPFFFNVQRWGNLLRSEPVVWYFPGSTTGQLMLVLMATQAVLLGSALIGLPLLRGRARGLPLRTGLGFLAYFLSLGLGFLLIEISFVQKYVLVLGYPTYSLSVTIFSLLVFAATGAALSRRGWARPRRFVTGLLALTIALVALEVAALPFVRERLLASPLAARIAATVLLQLPLGLVLGMYFPTGVELLRRREPRLVPWAWAVNGVASVASSVLAVLLAMQIGFSGVALVAAAIYALGALALLAVLGPEAGAAERVA
jgi:hypothetical protein